jgi:hypothetical protein
MTGEPGASLRWLDVIWADRALRRSIVVGALSFLILLTNAAASQGTPGPKFNPLKTYYLALGDSFSFGYQVTRLSTPPDPAAFDHGFVDGLGVYLRRIAPAITTVNYGCPGESMVTFIEGGCPATAQGFPLHDSFEGTQLEAAARFCELIRAKSAPSRSRSP